MKQLVHRCAILITGGILFSSLAIAQEQENEDQKKAWQEFANLPEETRKEFEEGLIKTQNLIKQKRTIDALQKTFDLENIYPNHPAVLHSRAACYVELRAFDKAKAIYTQLIETFPGNLSVLFNISELEFVSKNWQAAHDQFSNIVESQEDGDNQLVQLSKFKIFLCKLKLGNIEEAAKMQEEFTKWDNTPFYYFAKAAIFYNDNNSREAEKTLKNCYFVWNNSPILAPWKDTMMEAGYIPNVFSGDFNTKDDSATAP
ncbi:MAG: tetratricopeptide repeat protein [Akkermansiaceae bacterium]